MKEGAPECYRGDESQHRTTRNIGQAVDIWSLGCVFSEFAQWIAQGKKGLQRYRVSRQESIASVAPSHQDPGCFHDTRKVLKIVKDTHEDLFKHVRIDDFMMRPVIKKMVEEMLYEADGRPTASQLCYKAQKIVEQAEKELQQSQAPRKLSRSSTMQSWELNHQRPSHLKRTDVVSAPALPLSSSSYSDRSEPLSTMDAAELRSDASKNNIRPDESRRASLGKKTGRLNPPGETHSQPRRISHGHREGSITGPSSPPASMTTTTSNNSDDNGQLPYMSTSQALFYILSEKDGMGDLVPREARRYLNELDKRDHVSRPDGKMLHLLQ
jgi:serine/threonine protein kinase